MKKAADFESIDDIKTHIKDGGELPETFVCGWFLNSLGKLDFKRVKPRGKKPTGNNYNIYFKGVFLGVVFISEVSSAIVLDTSRPVHVNTLRGNPVQTADIDKLYIHSDTFNSCFKVHKDSRGFVKGQNAGEYELSAYILPSKNLKGIEALYQSKVKAHIFGLDTKTGETTSVLSLRGNATLVFHAERQQGTTAQGLSMYLFERDDDTQGTIATLDQKGFIDFVKSKKVAQWKYEEKLEVWIAGENNANSME